MVLAILLFISLQAGAQEVNFIPKLGFNLANTTQLDGNYKLGFNAGVGVEFMLNQRFAIEPGIHYSVQGSNGDVSESLRNDYINIPVYAKYYAYKGLFVMGGPQVGFLINSKLNEESVKEYMDTVDFSLGFGLGYQMDWGLVVSASCNIGLTNVFKKSHWIDSEVDPVSTRNSAFLVNLGWRF